MPTEQDGKGVSVGITGGETREYLLRILTALAPEAMAVIGKAAPVGTWCYDGVNRRLWVSTDKANDARVVVIHGTK